MKNEQKKLRRPPIVAIMGHIDHGKSTLLDYIRKTSITEREAGGITQSISAYEAEVNGRKITFLDTPGHEAFHLMRQSGLLVADIVVIIISAEDGVKPQTLESIKSVKASSTPFIIAINKIDKPNANVDKTKQELAEAEVLVEGWGGTVPVVPLSAKSGQGVDELLETILLQSDLDNFEGNPTAEASGFVLESNRDSKKGISATLIIKDGSIEKGMFVVAGGASAPVRIMEDCAGKSIDSASLSKPIKIIGWDKVPETGIEFHSFKTKQEAEKALQDFADTNGNKKVSDKAFLNATAETQTKNIPIIIKSDSLGSLNALEHEIQKLNTDKVSAKFISSSVGPINETDVKMAMSSPEIVLLGFGVKVDSAARDLSTRNNVGLKTFDVIYELVDWLRAEFERKTPTEEVEEITGTAKIVRVFSANKTKQIVGGVVESGEIAADEVIKIIRRESEIGQGKIKELQSGKVKTSAVREGQEFGIMIDSKFEIVVGDRISGFKKVTK